MRLALYEPGLGYYSAGARKFGAAGDFITAPEVAPVFSRCVAVQCARGAARTRPAGRRARTRRGFRRDGLRPARGTRATRRVAARVLDPRRQRRPARAPTRSAGRGSAAPARARPLARRVAAVAVRRRRVANEVLDALVVERFVVRGGRDLRARRRCGRGRATPARGTRGRRCAARGRAARRGRPRHERCPRDTNPRSTSASRRGWHRSPRRSQRGVMVFVDYGLPRREYYSAERTRGTLLCHFRHRFHDDALARVGPAGHHGVGRLHGGRRRGAGGRARGRRVTRRRRIS